MAKYNPVTPELLEELKKVVGASNVKTDAETLDRFKTDEETDPRLMHLPGFRRRDSRIGRYRAEHGKNE